MLHCFPLSTIIHRFLELLKSDEEVESIYSCISTALEALRQVHERQGMVLTTEVALTADSRNEADYVRGYLREGIKVLSEMKSSSRLACHTLLVNALLCVKSIPAEEVLKFAEEVEESDEKQMEDVSSGVSLLVQCALMHVVKTEKVRDGRRNNE